MRMETIHQSLTSQIDPIVFRAEWPESLKPELDSCIAKTAKIFWDVISYIIFPIILLRYLYDYLKDLALFLLVPGSIHVEATHLAFMGMDVITSYDGEKLKLCTPDGALLDAVFFQGETEPAKAIIFACGNGMQWETSGQRLAQLKEFGVSILMINPRGVGESQGIRSCEGYALDTYTGYEYLHRHLNIDLENILLVGHSMGAAYGSCGAALIQEKYPDKKISMMHDRSFGYLTTEVGALANSICCCLGSIAQCLLYPFCIEINSVDAFEKLKGQKCVIYSQNDRIIPYKEASLHSHLPQESCDNVFELEMDHSFDDHMRPYSHEEHEIFANTVSTFLKLNDDS